MEGLAISERRGFPRYCLEQPPYNLLDRRIENELVPLCKQHGLGIIVWCPMAQGMLTGRYSSATEYPKDSRAGLRGGIYAERICAKGIEIGQQFVALAERVGIPPVQLAVLWVKDQPGITAPIIGPRTLQHLEDLIPVGEMVLNDAIRQACDELVPPGSVVADFHNSATWMKMQVFS
jgi:aryl-alcohol dehydrogenase-like predicted oxidoreductase